MATDVAILSALAQVTDQELRYFELVTLRFGGKQRKVYLCIGRHAFFLVKKDVSALIQGGELFYAYLEAVVVDSNSKSDLLLVLNDNRPGFWISPNLFVLSSKRSSLVQHLQCCWTVDYMWRYGLVANFPKREAALTSDLFTGEICMPFHGYAKNEFQSYSFFLKDSFAEVPSVLQAENTGHYSDTKRKGFEVIIHVHEPVEISLLSKMNREHVRWVALEYKQMLTTDSAEQNSNNLVYYVLRNASYLKKMNLAEDIAMWIGWEMLVKTEKYVLIVVVLRRQYLPPLMSACQDVVVMFKSPNLEAEAIKAQQAGKKKIPKFYTDEELLLEAHLIADSLSPVEDEFPVYRDIVQAKLDSLRFDEDGYRFLENHVKLLPNNVREQGKSFLKSIFQLLVSDGMLVNGDQMLNDSMFTLGKQEKDDRWQVLPTKDNPLLFAEELVEKGEGLENNAKAQQGQTSAAANEARNNWNKRVARYFAYCLDGGLCRAFTLYDLIDAKAGLSAEAQKRIGRIIDYLLHLRPTDMSRRYFDVSIVTQLQESLENWEFNERVMQILLESDYIRKLFGRSREKEYSQCVGRLLANPMMSITLKSSLCRQIVSNPPSPDNQAILAPALVDVLKNTTSYYVQTCVCAALVVMTADSDQAKTLVMACGIAPLILKMVTSRDDDLVYHALMLVVNLSKHTHHRAIFVQYGLLPILCDILSSSYHTIQFKGKILLQLCAVIGQCCNDEESRKILTNSPHEFTLDCLMFVFDECPPRSALECKTLYCMRMCAMNSNDKKYRVGQHCYLKLLEELQDTDDMAKYLDFVYNALGFLLVIAEKVENAAALQSTNIVDILQRIKDDLYDVASVQEKVKALADLIRAQTHREQF
ncbi:unnamed protein product [Amoebophrya sp. A120]|nr:unnamed protein product [Amoebophrya sp. A120]|eukprot:GSA120T00021340001.1